MLPLDRLRRLRNTAAVIADDVDMGPAPVRSHADEAVRYVQAALGVELSYDSETLPVLDHYLRTVPEDRPEALALVIATAGAYFGEVMRRHLGGRWQLSTSAPDPVGPDLVGPDPVGPDLGPDLDPKPSSVAQTAPSAIPSATTWRLILPSGISCSPAGLVAAAIVMHDDIEDLDCNFEVPRVLRATVETVLARMSDVTEEEYYSLCGRFDTMVHLQDVLLSIAAQRKLSAQSQ